MDEKMKSRQENGLMVCTLFAFFVSGCSTVPMGNLIPFLRDTYDLSYDFSGMLLSLQSAGNLVAIFISGFLPALIGRRRTVLTTAVWMTVAYCIITFGLGGATLLPLACLMTGVARGGNTNFSNTMMSTLPGKKSAIGYNLLHGAFAVGALLAPLVLIACTRSNPAAWRYMTAGVLTLCVIQLAVYSRMYMPAVNEQKNGKKTMDRSFLKNRDFWLSAAILFFYISVEYAVSGWLVTYFQDIGILSENVSQLMSSLLWVVIFIGRMIGAALVGRVPRKAILLTDGIGLFVCFLIVFFSRSQLPIILGIMGVGLFMATIYTSAMAIGTEKMRGNDLGVSQMIFISCIGGVVTPYVVGLVAEHAGIQAGMGVVVLTTVALLAAILITVFSRSKEAAD
jgi:fucose permease